MELAKNAFNVLRGIDEGGIGEVLLSHPLTADNLPKMFGQSVIQNTSLDPQDFDHEVDPR